MIGTELGKLVKQPWTPRASKRQGVFQWRDGSWSLQVPYAHSISYPSVMYQHQGAKAVHEFHSLPLSLGPVEAPVNPKGGSNVPQ